MNFTNFSPFRPIRGWSKSQRANWVSKTIALSVGVLAMVFFIAFIVWAQVWTEPSLPPPLGNVPPPLQACSDCDTRFVNVTGDTMSGGLGMSNNNIDSINSLFINDPGANEGIRWNGTAAGWRIDVSPPGRTNADGDLNLYGTANNIHLWQPTQIDGNLTVSGNATVSGQNVCRQDGTNCPVASGGYWTQTGSNLYPNNTGWNVGIGTASPGSKLHVSGGTGPVNVLIEADTDNSGEADQPSITLRQDSGIVEGGLGYFNSTNQLTLKNVYNDALHLGTNNTNRLTILGNGNVGIGTSAPDPNYKITTSGGGVKAENNSATQPAGYFNNLGVGPDLVAGKITVGTIDPIFEIDGEKYATYVADFAGGVRIETSGVVRLERQRYLIAFDDLEKGSDLWLFWQASNKELNDVVVLLTGSFEGRVWYEKDGNTLTIYGEKTGEVSYRLSTPRVDYEKWGNLSENQSLEGIIVSNY